MAENRTSDGLLSGLLGAAVFLLFFLALDVGPWVSAALALGAWGAGFFLFSRKKPDVVAQESELRNTLTEGRRKLAEIRRFEKAMDKVTVANAVSEIATVTEKILTSIEEDASQIKQARQFLTYYLDSTIKILGLYVDLGSQDLADDGIQKSLARVEALVLTLKETFEKQLARLLSNDVLDLDTEISLLEQTIKMEGLGK